MFLPALQPFGLRCRWILAISLVLFWGLAGCASSRTAEEIAADRAQVLGTWKYETNGISTLQQGTLQIQMTDGQLVGRFNDRWRGQIDAHISLHGSHMEMNLNRFRITGEIEDGRFTGSVYRPTWDVSRAQARSRSSGSFIARRVRSGSISDAPANFGCASLLREGSYACSPFESP